MDVLEFFTCNANLHDEFYIALNKYLIYNDSLDLMSIIKSMYESKKYDYSFIILLMNALADENNDFLQILGDCYFEGNIVEKNLEKSNQYFMKLISKGNSNSYYDLAWNYYEDDNYDKAIEFYNLFLENQTNTTDKVLGKTYTNLGHSYWHCSIPNYENTINYLTIASDKYNNERASALLYDFYNFEDRFKDPIKAIYYLVKSANNGHYNSKMILIEKYIYGSAEHGIERDISRARNMLNSIVEQTADTYYLLGLSYYMESNDEYEYYQAIDYFNKSLSICPQNRIYPKIGYAYYCVGNYEEARKYLEEAWLNDDNYFSDFLGRIYYFGYSSAGKNLHQALVYYRSVEQNFEFNNIFTAKEYIDVLVEVGLYEEAYNKSLKFIDKYNNIIFYYIKNKLILEDKVSNSNYQEAEEELYAILNVDNKYKEVYKTLIDYNFRIKHYMQGINLYKKLFEIGDIDAAIEIARIYERGIGIIRPDLSLTYEWLKKAADKGSEFAKKELTCFSVEWGLFSNKQTVKRMRRGNL